MKSHSKEWKFCQSFPRVLEKKVAEFPIFNDGIPLKWNSSKKLENMK